MIEVVDTPNPDTKKFVFDKTIVESGTKEFKKNDPNKIDFVEALFSLGNLELVYLDKNFISIRKSKEIPWDDLVAKILETLTYKFNEKSTLLKFSEESEFTDDVSKRIEEVLNEKIRPAVAMDGGDIRLKSFKDGIAEVILKGACAGCPSSTVTLKHGVERMIKHYVPEVQSVEALNIND